MRKTTACSWPKPILLASILILTTPTLTRSEVIFENKGLYKKETWHVGKYYDDLDDRADEPGIVTSGKIPKIPSGPAVDLGNELGGKAPSKSRGGAR